jgi:hypothetical protein
MGLFLLLILELAIVHQAADGRLRGRRDLDQVDVFLFCQTQGVEQLDDAERFSLNPGQPDFRCADLAVDAVRFLSSDVDVLKESKKQAVPSS